MPVGELAVLSVGGDGGNPAIDAALDLQVFLRTEAGQVGCGAHDGAPATDRAGAVRRARLYLVGLRMRSAIDFACVQD